MNDTRSSSIQKTRDASLRKIAWAGLILATLYVCYFSHLGAFGFIGPDEPRYAWIARDMAETGDWVTPRLYGKPWFEKPVLYYWAAALSFKLFGVSEATARLPSALSALLATLALAWLALCLAGREVARWLLVLLPATIGVIGFSHAAAPDMPFSAMLTIAMVCAAVALELVPIQIPNHLAASLVDVNSPSLVADISSASAAPLPSGEPLLGQAFPEQRHSRRYLSLLLFGFFLGAAVLAKGPVAVILAGGAIFLGACFTRRWRDALRLFHPITVGAFLLTSLPWYILCARRNPDFFPIFIVEHNFKRYLTPEFQHIQPFWYYIPITLVALLPWVFWLAWFALNQARTSATQSERAQVLFLAAWGLFPLLFFSMSKSKLPGYILPAVPPLVFLISLAVARSQKSRHAYPRYALALTGLLFLLSACWVLLSKTGLGGTLVSVYTFFAVLGGLVVICVALLRSTRAGLISAVILMLFLLILAYVSVGKLEPQLSARTSAAQISPARAGVTYSFKLQRAWQYQLNFYLHREILEWSPDIPGEAVVVTTEKHLAELENSAEIIAVISDRSPQAEIVDIRPLPRNVAGGGQRR